MEVETDLFDAIAEESADDNTPVEIPIFNRDGEAYKDAEGNPAVFLVLGEFSDKVREFDRKKRIPNETAEDWLTRRAITALTGWRLEVGGKTPPFTPANARVLLKRGPWLHQYVAAGMTNHSSFFVKKS